MWYRKVLILLVSVATLGAICGSYYYFFHTSESNDNNNNQAQAVEFVEQICSPEVKKCEKANRLYHKESRRCFIKDDSSEVCGRHMAIWPVPACQIQGYCECDYDNHERLLIYHPPSDRCYFIYDQGPCPEGQVIVLPESRKTNATCEPDICYEEKKKVPSHDLMFVPFQNKCYHLYERLNKPGCKGELRFWKNQARPSCSPMDKSSLTLSPEGYLHPAPIKECLPGSVQYYSSDCGNFGFLSDYDESS